MTVFNPSDPRPLQSRLEHHEGLLIACYCAAWCDTCREYAPQFTELAADWPQHTFVWIDIEDHPELLGDEDVEDFPTILIQGAQGNLFFGEQLPYISHLDRLIKSVQDGAPLFDGGPASLRSLISELKK